MEKRLIPYSVHLPEHIYTQLKEAAQERKASSLVRDAITMIIEGNDAYTSGYNKAIRDAIAVIKRNDQARFIGVNGTPIAQILATELVALRIGVAHGKAKK
ncbi:MAG: hypothetical protein RJA72_607 [Pseudomonadota bacterium]|jgi:metal-responsive CopG/Arc/MetJ family transcriptional regulator